LYKIKETPIERENKLKKERSYYKNQCKELKNSKDKYKHLYLETMLLLSQVINKKTLKHKVKYHKTI
jgi:hypothetical protein